ncbi:MAG: hypothetical protein QG641_1114 [Candidatus Poribacteria bacterium]|nr:hypothetical protein [Candidatus Poribacteria bacterium]
MPAPTKIYFGQIASGQWLDWVQVVNVSNEESSIIAIARNEKGATVWSGEKTLKPFQAWVIPVEPASVQQELSLVVSSNKSIVGERHCHLGTEVLAFPGAAPELKSAGRRLFYPEIVAGAGDFFRVLNISDQVALVNILVRDIYGKIIKQFGNQIPPLGFWSFTDNETGNVQGTLEIVSTQLIVSERHLHYGETLKGVAVGQLGQVMDVGTIPTKIYFAQIAAGTWGDWVQVINHSDEVAKVTAITRNEKGEATWSIEKSLEPFQGWIVPADPVANQTDFSLFVSADKHIIGERHCWLEKQMLPFPGACPEMRTAGRRLFFAELVAGSYDFFRVLNITDQISLVNIIARNTEGIIVNQVSYQIPPFGYLTVPDEATVNVQGTLEMLSTQIVVGERHLHYGQQYHPGVAIGQLGQIID